MLYKNNILFICAYQPEYGGNFIKMLFNLGIRLKNDYKCNIYFLFPIQKNKEWLDELSTEFTIEFIRNDYHKSEREIYHYLLKWSIDLIHTHFEMYDIPTAKAVKKTSRNIHMIWHLHDYMSLDKTGLKFKTLRRIISNLRFWLHYGIYGKNAYFIGVSKEVTDFVNHYRRNICIFTYPSYNLKNNDYIRSSIVLNGIDLSRVIESNISEYSLSKNTFISFSGVAKSKGIHLILKAAENLYKKGYNFKIILTRNKSLETLLNEFYKENPPKWLQIMEQTNKISSLFSISSCYISASYKETMSMAIAEASIYGLPVIQSDIKGTEWNSNRMSTFVFKSGDYIDLQNKMEKVIKMDKTALLEYCKNTQKYNMELLSMDKWCDNIIKIYKNVITT